MPMLPSGKHVAINAAPLKSLLYDATYVTNVHKVLAIQTIEDLYPYFNVIWLVPESELPMDHPKADFREGSLSAPPGFAATLSGYRLAQHEEFTRNWSQEDRTAFWEFIHGRAAPVMAEELDKVRKVQHILRTQGEGMTKLMVMWWDAGVHPAQEGYQVDEWDRPEWDTYDMLAALGQLRKLMLLIDPEIEELQPLMRLNAFWVNFCADFYQRNNWPDNGMKPRQAAAEAREGKWLEQLSNQQRVSLHRQGVYECVAVWNFFGDKFQYLFPDQAKIIELVVVSAEANEASDS